MLKLSTIFRSILSSVMLSLLLAAGSGCKDSSQSQGAGWQPNVPFGTLPPGFDSFPERWNKQINDRLAREEAAKQKEIRELRDKFFKEEDSKVREKLQSKLIADEAALSVIHRRQTEGDYIKFQDPGGHPPRPEVGGWTGQSGDRGPECQKRRRAAPVGPRILSRHIPAQRPEQQQRFPRPPV